jgi:lipoate-protein ligase A
MSAPIRILDTGLRSPRWNVAMSAALTELHADGGIPDTVRFHRYQPCVLLGRNQDAASAMDPAYCAGSGIAGVHRVTGGGAVYMSPHMLAWDIVLDRALFGGDLARAAAAICSGVAHGVQRLGADASYRGPNDIAVGGRKISGTSGYALGRSAMLQGTILIVDETSVMARALRLPEDALPSIVTSLETELGAAPDLPQIVDAIIIGIATRLERETVRAEPSQHELETCETLLRGETRTVAEDRTCRASS